MSTPRRHSAVATNQPFLPSFVDHRSALAAEDDVIIMRPQPGTELSMGSSSWMKRLSSIWNVENIKVVRRVIVSVIGAVVVLLAYHQISGRRAL